MLAKMLPLIISVLIQSAVRVSSIVNDLECAGLVINRIYNDNDNGPTYTSEYGYPAGVCWSWAAGESAILQCDNNGITVIEYPNEDCSDAQWQVSYPTNGCTTWNEGESCDSYCSSGLTGCEYFTVKEYRAEYNEEDNYGCDANQSPLDDVTLATLDYWTRIVVIDYCYGDEHGDGHGGTYEWNGYFKFAHNSGEIIQTFYSEASCTTQLGDTVTFGTVGVTTCEVYSGSSTPHARYITYGTASNDNLQKEDISINGLACVATGDPHFLTFNGLYHHFQGQDNEQYYYIAPCKGWTSVELPFTILATHAEWTTGSPVMGVEDLVLELYESATTQYLLFVSPAHTGYIQGTTYGTKYDDNYGQTGYTVLTGGETIGSRFKFSQDDDLYTLTIDNDVDCALIFKFEGRTVTILPPICYKEYICGLCGEFNAADGILRGCNNEPVPIDQDDEAFWQDPLVFDTHGNGWSKSYFDENCAGTTRRRLQTTELAYTPVLPENFTIADITNPCDPSIESLATTSCKTARANAATCCGILGSDFCDSLQDDCAFDACVSSGNDATAVDGHVKELFTDAVNSVCTIPEIDAVFDPQNLEPSSDTDETDGTNALNPIFSMVYSTICILFTLWANNI